MKFQTFDEAEKCVAAINQELQFLATFGSLAFPAKCSVRKVTRNGRCNYCLNAYLGTVACMVPSSCEVTHLKPTSQLGMDALGFIQHAYSRMKSRAKGDDEIGKKLKRFAKRMGYDT